MLALLNAANNRVSPPLLEYAEFYNSALDHINLMAEYYRWQTPEKSNKYVLEIGLRISGLLACDFHLANTPKKVTSPAKSMCNYL